MSIVRISVNADVCGVWCVHQAVGVAASDGFPLWMVSHRRSGASLGSLLGDGTSYSVATMIARALGDVPWLNEVDDDVRYAVQAIVADSLEMEPPL